MTTWPNSTRACFGQWVLEMNHVAAIVGGFSTQEKHIGQEGVLFTPVPRSARKRR